MDSGGIDHDKRFQQESRRRHLSLQAIPDNRGGLCLPWRLLFAQEDVVQLSTGRHSVPNIGQKKAEKLKCFFFTHGEDGIPQTELPGADASLQSSGFENVSQAKRRLH